VSTVGTPGPFPQEPGFWWRAGSPIGALLMAFLVSGVVAIPLSITPMGDDGLLTVVQFASSLLILVFGLLLLRGLPALDRRRALAPKGGLAQAVGIGVAVGLAMVALSIAIIGIGLALDPGLEKGLDDIALEFEPVPWQTATLVVALVVLAPLGEEVLFRVLLLRALVRRMSFWRAAPVSAVLFALAHPDGYLLWPRMVSLVVSGVALAWIYRERGYPASVAAHATLNAIAAISVATT
jgi:membrane protease YdiL (CAAX protease family)